jgi:hypothetical protein
MTILKKRWTLLILTGFVLATLGGLYTTLSAQSALQPMPVRQISSYTEKSEEDANLPGASDECSSLPGHLFSPHLSMTEEPCAQFATSILALTDIHGLFLCEAGHTVQSFRISIGKNGVGKKMDGDFKTPLGTYNLEQPRPHRKFHRQITIDYPTARQRQLGYSGSAIEIHAPTRLTCRLGFINLFVDWTDGCLAVGNDYEIDEIADWITKHPKAQIHILENLEPIP